MTAEHEEGGLRRESLLRTSFSALAIAGRLTALAGMVLSIAEQLGEVAEDDPMLTPEIRAAIDDCRALNGRLGQCCKVLEAKVDLA